MTSYPFTRRTLATLRRAELGFFGVVVYTLVQTPRRCGQLVSATDLLLYCAFSRPLRMSCWMVGIGSFSLVFQLFPPSLGAKNGLQR